MATYLFLLLRVACAVDAVEGIVPAKPKLVITSVCVDDRRTLVGSDHFLGAFRKALSGGEGSPERDVSD